MSPRDLFNSMISQLSPRAIHELTAQVSRIRHAAQHKRSGIHSLVSDCSCSSSKFVPGLRILFPKSNLTSLACVNEESHLRIPLDLSSVSSNFQDSNKADGGGAPHESS